MRDDDMLILKNGGRFDFWVSQLAVIARFVEAHVKELTKIQVAAQAPIAQAAEVGGGTRVASRIIWDPTRGGMRMPHLHYAGEIFVLSASQWADFSKTALSALTEKMNKAQNVTFENVMRVSEALAEN